MKIKDPREDSEQRGLTNTSHISQWLIDAKIESFPFLAAASRLRVLLPLLPPPPHKYVRLGGEVFMDEFVQVKIIHLQICKDSLSAIKAMLVVSPTCHIEDNDKLVPSHFCR